MKNAFMILLAVLPLCAQQPPAPPAVLRIFREDIKEGKDAAHEKTEAAFMQAAAKAKYPANILTLTSMTGTSQALFLEGHDTFASIAESQTVLETPEFGKLDVADAELRISARSMIATYRPDLSYAVDKINLPKVRYFNVETIRAKLDQGQKFVELARQVVAGAQKSGDTQPVATYQVVSGAPSGTYLLLEPMESLKSMDEGPERDRALVQATRNGPQTMRELSETIANQESLLFAVAPAMSLPAKEWIAASPEFWTPKPAPAAAKGATEKSAAKKPAKKK
jgi:hypothetical protein